MWPATDEELGDLGLTQEMLAPQNSDFRAAVYKLDPEVWGEEYKGRYITAFRGSTLSPQDWRENMRQGMNEYSEYYKNAVVIGESIKTSGFGEMVKLVGHSHWGAEKPQRLQVVEVCLPLPSTRPSCIPRPWAVMHRTPMLSSIPIVYAATGWKVKY